MNPKNKEKASAHAVATTAESESELQQMLPLSANVGEELERETLSLFFLLLDYFTAESYFLFRQSSLLPIFTFLLLCFVFLPIYLYRGSISVSVHVTVNRV